MAFSYEVTVSTAHSELFERALLRYLEERGFAHAQVGSWLSGDASHEFRRGQDQISLTILTEGQTHYRLAVQSETVLVEPLVLDVLTEQLAESLKPFSAALSTDSSRETLGRLIRDLRDAFDEVVGTPD